MSFTVALVRGGELARLMIQRGAGVAVMDLKIVKRIDNDYFSE